MELIQAAIKSGLINGGIATVMFLFVLWADRKRKKDIEKEHRAKEWDENSYH